MEVRLVGVAALCGYQRGAMTRGEAVCRVVETDELGGALGGDADLGSESGPETLAAPPDLGCQSVDSDPPPVGDHLRPGEGNFGVDRAACLVSATERGLCNREPVLPLSASAQLLLDSHGVASPEVIEGDHRPTQLRRGAQHRVRDHRRQPYLEALDVTPMHSNAAGREAGSVVASLPLTTGVVDEQLVAEVDYQRGCRIRDHRKVDAVLSSIAKSRHADAREPARP